MHLDKMNGVTAKGSILGWPTTSTEQTYDPVEPNETYYSTMEAYVTIETVTNEHLSAKKLI